MPGGRPPVFDNAEELQLKVDDYFRQCAEDSEPLTITGLALSLGFESRQSFYDYEEKEEFSYIIKKARFRVEKGYELRLSGTAPTGSIFALKNMGWKDKTESDVKHSGVVNINYVHQAGNDPLPDDND